MADNKYSMYNRNQKEYTRYTDVFNEKRFDNSKHDRISKGLEQRLINSSTSYDIILHSAEYYKPNGDSFSDADVIAFKGNNILYFEVKSIKKNYLVQKGHKQLNKAKRYCKEHYPEHRFYGFLVTGKKGKHRTDNDISRYL